MSWLKTPEERAYSLEDPNTPLAKALMFLGGERATVTGRAMNDGAALSLAPFYNGVAIISGDIGTIPVKVYRRLDGGGRAEENGHAIWSLLTMRPHPMVTSSAWREASQGHLLLRGNSYAEVESNSRGVVTGWVPLNPNVVTRKGEFYEIGGSPPLKRVHMSRMLHIHGPGGNGIDGWSVIALARENLSLAQALEESNLRFMANAMRPSGFITQPTPMKPEQLNRLKGMFAKRSGVENTGRTLVLDNGAEWKQIGLSAEDSQFMESRQFSVTDQARWLNIPPYKIGDLERATFSNIAEQATDYVMGTLRPWVVRHEQELNTKLLTDKERASGLFIAYNLDGLLRGDVKTRAEVQKQHFEIGGLTTNEMRAQENRNPVPGGDRAMVRLDMVPLDRIDEVQSVETDAEGRTKIIFRSQVRKREIRSHESRIALRSAFRTLFLDAAGRMVRGEIRNIRRLLKRASAEDLLNLIGSYYMHDHPSFAGDVMGPVFRSYTESVSSAAAAEIESEVRIDTVTTATDYVAVFVARYSSKSRRELADRAAEQVEERLIEWQDGTATANPRHEQVAQRELVRLGESVTRSTFVAGGILSLVWRTLGDSCPYCTRLNGKVVSRTTPFLFGGEEFEGEGTDTPLVPRSDVSHAPAHRGCDCTLVPGAI